jgi:hypothetical protein
LVFWKNAFELRILLSSSFFNFRVKNKKISGSVKKHATQTRRTFDRKSNHSREDESARKIFGFDGRARRRTLQFAFGDAKSNVRVRSNGRHGMRQGKKQRRRTVRRRFGRLSFHVAPSPIGFVDGKISVNYPKDQVYQIKCLSDSTFFCVKNIYSRKLWKRRTHSLLTKKATANRKNGEKIADIEW